LKRGPIKKAETGERKITHGRHWKEKKGNTLPFPCSHCSPDAPFFPLPLCFLHFSLSPLKELVKRTDSISHYYYEPSSFQRLATIREVITFNNVNILCSLISEISDE